MKTYIINPDNNKPVSIEDWSKDADPTRARLLAIETDDGHLLVMSKSYLPGGYTFNEAQKACADFRALEGLTFRCPTRKECIDLYDARFQGLDAATELTDGNFANRDFYHWTSEKDANPNHAGNAWCSFGYYGYMGYYNLYSTHLALPVALLR